MELAGISSASSSSRLGCQLAWSGRRLPSRCPVCAAGSSIALRWAGIQRTPDPGEMAPKSGAGTSRAQGAGSTFMLLPWALLGALKRGWSRAGTGDEHGQPCRVLAGAAAEGGGLRIPSPGRAAAWQRRPKTRQGNGRRALPFACPHGALPLLPWALPPAPQLPRLLPPSTATPSPCLGCVCHPELFPADHLSFLSIPSPLAASKPSASRTLLLLLSCPLRWFVNFLAPGIQCSYGCRGNTVCWARWAGAIQPLPGTGKKTTKSEKTQPTTCLSNAPWFLYIDCVI